MTTSGDAVFRAEYGERLAVVEDQLKNIRSDVSELKADVRALLLYQSSVAASDSKGNRWVDNIMKSLPIILSTVSLLITLIGLVVVSQLSERGIA